MEKFKHAPAPFPRRSHILALLNPVRRSPRSTSKPFATSCCARGPIPWRERLLAKLSVDPEDKPSWRTWRRTSSRSGPAVGTSGKLKVGVDIPTPAEVRALIEATARRSQSPCARLPRRASLGCAPVSCADCAWAHLELGNNPKVTIEERADENNVLGVAEVRSVEAHASGLNETTVKRSQSVEDPAAAVVISKDGDGNQISRPRKLVFGTATDRPDGLANIRRRLLGARLDQGRRGGAAARCRRASRSKDRKGKPVMQPKYTGLHCLRHFAISSWLRRRAAATSRPVQTRAGHATLALTLDTYGHLLDAQGRRPDRRGREARCSAATARMQRKRNALGAKSGLTLGMLRVCGRQIRRDFSSFPSYVSRVRFPSPAPTRLSLSGS